MTGQQLTFTRLALITRLARPINPQPELRDTDQFEFAVSLITYEAHRRTERQNASVAALEQEVKVASSSNPGTVAGSIAGRVRSGERCVVG